MSEWFACVIKEGGVYFTESNSHEVCVDRLDLQDDRVGREREFLRACAPDGDMARFAPDEDEPGNLPAWYMEHEAEYRTAVARILELLAPWRAQRVALYAGCADGCVPLYADYKAKCDALYADYKAQCAPLYADYKAQCAPLYADYKAWRDALYTDCAAQRDALDARLTGIPGYVPAPRWA